jgi:hypothetical protein
VLVLSFAPLEFAHEHAGTLGPTHTFRAWCAPEASRSGPVSLPWPYVQDELPLPYHLAGANSLRLQIYAIAITVRQTEETDEEALSELNAEIERLSLWNRLIMSTAAPAEIRALGLGGRLRSAILDKGGLLEVVDGVVQMRHEDGTVLRPDSNGLFPPPDESQSEAGSGAAACASCGKAAPQKCSACGEVAYCARSHALATSRCPARARRFARLARVYARALRPSPPDCNRARREGLSGEALESAQARL